MDQQRRGSQGDTILGAQGWVSESTLGRLEKADIQPAVWLAQEHQKLAAVMTSSLTAKEGSPCQTKWLASQYLLSREGKEEASGLGRNNTGSRGHLSIELCPSYTKGYDLAQISALGDFKEPSCQADNLRDTGWQKPSSRLHDEVMHPCQGLSGVQCWPAVFHAYV